MTRNYRTFALTIALSLCALPAAAQWDGWYIGGNILVGGLIGWFIVDPLTGAMYTLPKEVNADLRP